MITPHELRQISSKAPTLIERVLKVCEEAAGEGRMYARFPYFGFDIEYEHRGNGHYPKPVARTDEAKLLLQRLIEMGFSAEPYCFTAPFCQAGVQISWEETQSTTIQ